MLMLILMLYSSNSSFAAIITSLYIDSVSVYYRVSKEEITDLELSAVRAMSAVLCCGPVFDPNGLNDDGYIYKWAHMLLSSHEDRVGHTKSRSYEVK